MEKLTFEENFWSDKRKSSEIIKNMNFEKNIVSRYEKLATEIDDEEVLIDFVESGEASFENELQTKHKILKNKKESYQIEISISHSRKYATAMAIIL